MGFLVNLIRGTEENPSIVGLKKCTGLDWLILAVFLGTLVLISLK